MTTDGYMKRRISKSDKIIMEAKKEHKKKKWIKFCPVCKSTNVIFASYYGEGDFWKNPLMDPEAVTMAVSNAQECLRWIGNYLEDYQGKKLLDIGAHYGFFVAEAEKFGFHARGIEINKHAVAEAHKRGISLHLGSAEKFPITGPFDVITMFHVLEHVEDPQLIINNIVKNLRPGGLFIMEVPNIESYLAKHHGLSWKYIALEHLWYFSPATLRKLLADSGFQIVFWQKRNYEIGYMSLGWIRQYFFPSRHFYYDRFRAKVSRTADELPPTIKLLHTLAMQSGIKRFLSRIIHWLQRGDHLLVVARKI